MSIHSIYPAGPEQVPANLTEASKTYRRHAWFAVLGLFTFVAAYFGLMIWLGFLVYTQVQDLSGGRGNEPLISFLLIGIAGFLVVFMAKPLFSIQRGHSGDDLELKPEDQPLLFEFLHKLADEAGAPRPKRVFVSPRVNASVFYDLSILNLIFPSKKNLEIGLALVNVLSLGELKAVLAHEFGHFAQRSMAVGRWVYVAQQIAGHIVAQRGALDRFVEGLSRVDFRIAWVGWLLSLIIWSIRSLVELLFRLVVLAQRALSREMEYQADLVATALTGSDALVHALHKLGAADEAWQQALAFAEDELKANRVIDDLFAVQSRIIMHLRIVQADPNYGRAPPIVGEAKDHRVFVDSLAKPPAMWSTHPENSDRERNVKERYVAASIDPRPGWELFQNAASLRQRVTRELLRSALKEPDTVPSSPIAESLAALDKQFDLPSLKRRYRGSYLNRALTRHAATVAELFESIPGQSNLGGIAAELYDDRHDQDLDRLRALTAEAASIKGLIAGALSTGNRNFRWRGEELKREDLPKTLAAIESELAQVRDALHRHDRRARSVHRAMAEQLGEGWALHLHGLLSVMHFAEHAHADLQDTQRVLAHTYRVVTADKSVSKAELKLLIDDCNVVQRALARLHQSAPEIRLDATLLTALKTTDWASMLGELKLPPANQDNIQSWLGAVDGWVGVYLHALDTLQQACLQTLLGAEERVLAAYRQGEALPPAPQHSVVPEEYPCLLPGCERPTTLRLNFWDRFQSADGAMATGLRFVSAGSILGGLLWLSAGVGDASLTIHNGLSEPVTVRIDQTKITVPAGAHVTTTVSSRDSHQVLSQLSDQHLIERLTLEPSDLGRKMLYNVAGASSLVLVTASYGNAAEREPRFLGNPILSNVSADHVFTDPPAQIRTKSGGDTRTALQSLDDLRPSQQVALSPEAGRDALIRAHVRFDQGGTERLHEWLALARDLAEGRNIIVTRSQRLPNEVVTLRALQDSGTASEQQESCAVHQAQSAAAPDNPDLIYLAIRCESDSAAQNQAFVAALARFPEHPWLRLARANILAERVQWDAALAAFVQSYAELPEMRGWARSALVRLARLRDQQHDPDVVRALVADPDLEALVRATDGQSTAGYEWTKGYAWFSRGDLRVAADAMQAKQNPDALIKLAASDGADANLIEQAMRVSVDTELEASVRMLQYALIERQGGNGQIWLDAAVADLDESDAALARAFLMQMAAGLAAETNLSEMPPQLRAQLYAAARVRLGRNCPPLWEQIATRYLFISERPYFAGS
ncbi:Zn-dependent protease with chaperone function [Ahniella affigens]|uniref:Zn-dependent protease with chaperone function n=1 Tax=Ahniella affigens TaxID=2021234 RepID=A0A2P1PVZ4_9GAMM|nr:M48 family metallopeptidase [Ahniella affigens]AVP99021.1 Zn-dependent protease with chaperone function [Ahniella affigens]